MFENEIRAIKRIGNKILKARKWILRCGCLMVLAFTIFIVYVLVYAVFCYPLGWNSTAASIKWYRFMEEGNGVKAIYWANRVVYYETGAFSI